MAPPVAVIVIASIATSAALAYAVKETWEPHIKPELKKAQQTVRTWWNKRPKLASPIGAGSGLRRGRGGDRPPSPVVPDESTAATRPSLASESRLESFFNSALQLPNEGNRDLRQRNNHSNNRDGGETPNETVEMSELDKANPWIYHPPLSPVFSSTQPTNRDSVVSNPDPFSDEHTPNPNLDSDGFLQPQIYDPRLAGHSTSQGTSLGLSFVPPPISVSHPSPTSPSSSRTPRPSVERLSSASPNVSATMTSPGSVFSWVDASGSPNTQNLNNITRARSATLDDSEDAFSIGSYDDLTSTQSSRSRREEENDGGESPRSEPMSPPHHSEQGSPGVGGGGSVGSGSESGWESVGSPRSSVGR